MADKTFVAQVSDQCAAVEDAMLAVFKTATQHTIEIAQTPIAKGGHMPVDTGFLRASGQASTDGSLPDLVPNPGVLHVAKRAGGGLNKSGGYEYDTGQVNLVISRAQLGDTITFAYGANYAIYQEHLNQFVGLAAQQWPQTVAAAEAEASKRIKLNDN